MYNTLVLVIPLLVVLGAFVLGSLPPRLEPLSPEDLRNSGEYHARMNRRGVYTNPRLTPVVEVGTAQPKRVFLLPPRQW